MSLIEADTRAKLIDPALHKRGWTEDLIRREESAGGIEIINGKARRRTGRVDYVLRVKVNPTAQPVPAATLWTEGPHVEYRRGAALTEWYLNSPFGLEQGLTLLLPPAAMAQRRCGSNSICAE